MRLAVVGKGGSGKSLVAGTLARIFARDHDRVLALDLDFMPGISMSLGMQASEDAMFAGMAERDSNGPGGWAAKIYPELAQMVLQHSAVGPDGVRLLQIGKVRTLPTGESFTASLGACYQILGRLSHDQSLAEWTLVCDHPAGMTLSTGVWVAHAQTFVVVVEPGGQSVLTARRLMGLRTWAPVLFVANKTAGRKDVDYIESSLGEPVFGVVPADIVVGAANRAGAALIDFAPDSSALVAIQQLADRLKALDKSGEATDKEER